MTSLHSTEKKDAQDMLHSFTLALILVAIVLCSLVAFGVK